jgi:hypothetical protein
MRTSKQDVYCPYCGRRAELTDSSEIYGMSYGSIYICRPCDAYVGCHGNSNKPLGRLANTQLRKYKQAAHSAFDPIWKDGYMDRGEAYYWLSRRMKLPENKTHIGMFDVPQCKQVIEISNKFMEAKESGKHK